MTIEPAFSRYSFIDYKGDKQSTVPFSIAEIGEFNRAEARWGKKYRNNDPDHPRIPKVGDKVKLDVLCFLAPRGRFFNGKTGIIIDKQDEFFIFQYKDKTIPVLPMDIQWYYD